MTAPTKDKNRQSRHNQQEQAGAGAAGVEYTTASQAGLQDPPIAAGHNGGARSYLGHSGRDTGWDNKSDATSGHASRVRTPGGRARLPGEPSPRDLKKPPVFLKKGTVAHYVYEYGLLLLGSLIIALSFNWFLAPNQVASGGVTGISVLVLHLFNIQPAITQWALNIPLFLLGLIFLGRQFGLKTAVGSFVLPLFVLLTQHGEPLTDNLLLATIYGGIGLGVGLGIVFRGRGSTGGLDLAAQLIRKFTGISLAVAVPMLDAMVIIAAGFVLDAEKALFALIGLYVTGKTIDVVQMGFGYAKVAYIISEEEDAIADAILLDLDRGLTRLNGAGGYTGAEKTVLMVVVSQTEVSRLKELVQEVDPRAFIIISETREVLGKGFKLES